MLQRHYFEESRPLGLNNTVLSIGFPVGHESFELANTRDVLQALQAQYAAQGFANLSVKLVESDEVKGAPKPVVAPKPAPSRPADGAPGRPDAKSAAAPVAAKPQPMTLSKEEFLSDPLIRDALEVFKATLVEARAPSPEATA